MAPDQTPWRDGIETKEAEKQRGKLYQCSVRPSDQKMSGGRQDNFRLGDDRAGKGRLVS